MRLRKEEIKVQNRAELAGLVTSLEGMVNLSEIQNTTETKIWTATGEFIIILK